MLRHRLVCGGALLVAAAAEVVPGGSCELSLLPTPMREPKATLPWQLQRKARNGLRRPKRACKSVSEKLAALRQSTKVLGAATALPAIDQQYVRFRLATSTLGCETH